ncbi:hypothetical protein TWF679_000615 [Orbilia oligospora]|uniref:Uncharacterized protein n=1 Tax=Orbilia oligospora TaxID=2813651 RepID=A0A8H8UXE4_ORBOL|nr:hypothetical protein TWF679_000615 [Orbilia oligospora]
MAFPGGGMPGMGPFGRPTGGGGGGAATPDFNSLSPEQQQMVMVKQVSSPATTFSVPPQMVEAQILTENLGR